MSVLKVDHLTKDFGHGRGIFDVSFEVGKGEVFGFLGPNGAGKTTTIRHLMGFINPQKGTATINGKNCGKKRHEILSDVGYLPGEIALPEGLTGWEFLRMMQKMKGAANDARLTYLLEKFELDPTGSTKRMSLGVKRKLAIVAAFLHDPAILILDEPTSGLDPVMQGTFIAFMKEEKERGKTILLSSHIFNEVDATCERIAIIKDGNVVSTVLAADIRHHDKKTFEVTFASTQALTAFSKEKDITVFETDLLRQRATVTTDDAHINGMIRTLNKYAITSFIEKKFTLETYFMHFYKSDKTFGGLAHA
ncbi:MAG: ABC transporter ATP-binding protein [Oscillospiraceae bacterium]